MDETPNKPTGKRLQLAFSRWRDLEKQIPKLEIKLIALKAKRTELASELRAAMLMSDRFLSKRQVEVWTLVKLGKSNKEIGMELNVSERTAKFHVSALLDKFDKRSRHDL